MEWVVWLTAIKFGFCFCFVYLKKKERIEKYIVSRNQIMKIFIDFFISIKINYLPKNNWDLLQNIGLLIQIIVMIQTPCKHINNIQNDERSLYKYSI